MVSSFKSIIVLIQLSLLISCASRTFHINSEPITAKVYYQTFKTGKFKGYTPLSVKIPANDIGPSSKIVVETEGYKRKEVSVGGFEGTDVYLLIKLEPEIASAVNSEISSENVKWNQKPVKESPPPKKDSQKTDQEAEIKPKKEDTPATDKASEDGNIKSEEIPIQTANVEENLPKGDEQEKTDPSKKPETKQEKTSNNPESSKVEDLMNRIQNLESALEKKTNSKEQDQISAPALDINNINKAMQHILKAQRLVNMNKLDEGLIETFKALAINEKLSSAYALQGSIYYLKKDYPSCMAAWQQAFNLDPTNIEVYEMLKFMRSKFGQ